MGHDTDTDTGHHTYGTRIRDTTHTGHGYGTRHGYGPCIPTKADPTAQNPGRYYYKCPVTNPCRQWNGWCDNDKENVSDSADDRTCDFTGPFRQYNVDLNNNLRELILAIRNAICIVVIHSVIGIVICVLLVIHLLYR